MVQLLVLRENEKDDNLSWSSLALTIVSNLLYPFYVFLLMLQSLTQLVPHLMSMLLMELVITLGSQRELLSRVWDKPHVQQLWKNMLFTLTTKKCLNYIVNLGQMMSIHMLVTIRNMGRVATFSM